MHNPCIGGVWRIGRCADCGKVALRQAFTQFLPSERALDLIEEEFRLAGKMPLSNANRGHYGSGWYCEFPVAVSMQLDAHGEQAARNLIRSSMFGSGCKEAMRIVHDAMT